MNSGFLLVRARLRRDPSLQALARVLVPEEPGAAMSVGHRLVWTLFADAPDRRRDFLWRRTSGREFLILARRPPEDRHGLFEIDFKEFAPVLAPDQRLRFDLRVNPTIAAPPKERGARGDRVDAITRAIAQLPVEPDAEKRRLARAAATEAAAAHWLATQGTKHGFTFSAPEHELLLDEEEWVHIPRGKGDAITFLAVTLRGTLTIRDPERLREALGRGFGSAKAFGCGLMLIRRARP